MHHKLLHLRCYLGMLSAEGAEPEHKSDESRSEPLYTNEGRDVMIQVLYIVNGFTSAVTGSRRIFPKSDAGGPTETTEIPQRLENQV